MCKRRLQRWNKVEFKRADLEIAVLKGELSGLLNQSDSFPDCNRIYYLQNQIKALWKREEIYWSQRSRVKWLNWGDRNSKFFHASTVQRRERNRIIRLSDGENGWIEGRDNIFAHILQHFEGIYTSDSQEISDEIRGCIPNCISANMNTLLLRPVSELEIKKVVDGLGALKAPGPDGLNGLFFQKNWETVKTDVIKVVLDFFEGGCLPSEVNETIVSLIPKIPMAESLNHLRPISCCNFIYKVISKIIVVRMKDLMGSVITPNQSAFVGGRLIQDNLIVAHEAFHALRKKDKGGKDHMAIKLDMNKAYDRLDWGFLKNILLCFGFDPGWVAMVMKLVTSVTYAYKVNGFTSATLIPKRGLRQGDPLSPYLFILAVDVLSLLIHKSVVDGRLEGFCLARGAPTLTHLLFADDALLFSKASPQNAFELVRVLNLYSRCSGQRINLAKSGLICGKFVREDCKQNLSRMLGMECWENPGKYLGLPGDWGRSKSNGLDWIKERVVSKLQGWREGLLNQAGKEVLIKSVIQAIPSYAMAMVKFPITFCKKLCSAVAQFWWSSGGKERGIHWKSWRVISGHKMEGGWVSKISLTRIRHYLPNKHGELSGTQRPFGLRS